MKLHEVFTTLLYSWGSDTPNEAVWSANELLDWLNENKIVDIADRFEETSAENFGDINEMLMSKIEKVDK